MAIRDSMTSSSLIGCCCCCSVLELEDASSAEHLDSNCCTNSLTAEALDRCAIRSVALTLLNREFDKDDGVVVLRNEVVVFSKEESLCQFRRLDSNCFCCCRCGNEAGKDVVLLCPW